MNKNTLHNIFYITHSHISVLSSFINLSPSSPLPSLCLHERLHQFICHFFEVNPSLRRCSTIADAQCEPKCVFMSRERELIQLYECSKFTLSVKNLEDSLICCSDQSNAHRSNPQMDMFLFKCESLCSLIPKS